MARIVLPYPVLPGKTAEDVRRIARALEADPEGYVESRRRAGVTVERAYLQQTPMGMFVAAYLETSGPIEQALSAPGRSDLPIDRLFAQMVRDVHGVDLTQPPPGPPPEVVGEWVDPEVTERRRGMAFCAPMVPGMEDRGRAWAKETFSSAGMTQSRRELGENIEIVTLVHTPQGPVVAVYLEGEDPFEANRRFAAATDPFNAAFKEELRQLFPPFIDFGRPVPGISDLFDSQRILTAHR